MFVLDEQPSKGRKRSGKFANMVGRYDRRHASNLYHNMVERHLVVERLTATEFAVIADQSGFDCAAANKLDDARDDAECGKYTFSIR